MNIKHKDDEFILVTDQNFNEQVYLASNRDVAHAVKEGHIESGKMHFEQFGRQEKRRMNAANLSNNLLKNLFINCFHRIYSLMNTYNKSNEKDTHYIKRNQIVQEYITGVGIEIGALHNPIFIPPTATIRYVDKFSREQLRQHYPELANKPLVDVDVITDGEALESIEDRSQDFVVANHFLEHCQNPLLAIENMFRVLKQSGILYIALPDKRYSFDIARPITPYEHLVQDYTQGSEISRNEHFKEWVKLVNHVTDEYEIRRQVEDLIRMDYSIHFHVWTQNEMIELVLHLKKQFKFEVELIYRNINEMIFVLRKS